MKRDWPSTVAVCPYLCSRGFVGKAGRHHSSDYHQQTYNTSEGRKKKEDHISMLDI
jgi:hypothetical protein